MTTNQQDELRTALKNAIFAIPDEQLVSRDIIIHAINAALSVRPVASKAAVSQEDVRKDALEEAAKVCDQKYVQRCASGRPTEALMARILAAAIRSLQAQGGQA